MSNIKPKISIIIPVYNSEKYLKKCLDSILLQSFRNFELLLINDGSTDSSGRICDEYAKKSERIRVFHKANGGVSSARNIGLDKARGEWVMFVDSDDWLEDNALYIVSKNIDNNLRLFQFNTYRIYDTKKELSDKKLRECCFCGIKKYSDYAKPELWNYCFNHNVISALGLRFNDIKYAEDQLFVYTYLSYPNLNVKYIATPLYNYRIVSGSATNKYIDENKLSDNIIALQGLINLWKRARYKAVYKRSIKLLFNYYLQKVSTSRYSNQDMIKAQMRIRSLIEHNLTFFLINANAKILLSYFSLKGYIILRDLMYYFKKKYDNE